ncbi:conserved Plasmodium protein, unknown function [Plasmodium berghei]|uniref:Uncharacterized protein n=2 Tax=Plasmodium berghei TaxID=5821 RepID=A0A509AMH1_PLABA|nr:conserved Plasmodium protein, unknown function [Plasmodium berghei ANKA]CXI45339.1 conserved Plasmodium protein, unknown function [Plasmodium berghei]SCM22654.1 conserved Plasmodium protein, unknown function [Plasmodium berghei]SCN25574.1 conserved Plasmodium protein, unknown function [Plasmodium berghei]SCO62289.1 conserved Plasmodium protein, unknown function [Plasmodium berghei]VUC55894.1 conserved Plasmodium protein, unknown function [Plasmodium berghei ANKA]|eukprot:XP_034421704.1 conserved Plasmodium protein, unknown function [Plasmodium berghei ANKA]
MLNRRIWYLGNDKLKRVFQNDQKIENNIFGIRWRNFSGIIGKYNKRDKKKFIISLNKNKKNSNDFIGGKYQEQNIKKRNQSFEKNIYLNKIYFKDKEKVKFYDKTEIIETNNIKNDYIRGILNKNNIFYIYTYQYLLIEFLKYNKIFVDILYSDSMLSYILYSFYKIYVDKSIRSNSIYHNINTSVKGEVDIVDKRKMGKEENINKSKYSNNIEIKKKCLNENVDNKIKHISKADKKCDQIDKENRVLLVGCSENKISEMYETIMNFKNLNILTYIISNEESINNMSNNIFLYNMFLINLENFKDDYDFSILIEYVNFIVIDDIYEIYKNKKSNLLKNILKIYKKNNENDKSFKNSQILLLNKVQDEWIIKEIRQYLKSINYGIDYETQSLIEYSFINNISQDQTNHKKKNIPISEINKFHYFDLSNYKKNNCTHMSVNIPFNDDKKFLVLFYLLNINKDKKIVIYYNKNDIYSFYSYINSYMPCIFISNTYKNNFKNNIISNFNKNNNYILITDDRNIKKLNQINANLFIHYNFPENISSYIDLLIDGFVKKKKNKDEATRKECIYINDASEICRSENISGNNDNGNEFCNILEKGMQSFTTEKIYSILFYNKKKVHKEYKILDNVFNFTNYELPSMRNIKNNFLNFLIHEITSANIESDKHLEEAKHIYEKYGHKFISASLYYIMEKKLYKKSFKNKEYTNITFIVERNVFLNTKNKLIEFLNHLLNFNKNVGDIKFFIQNYLYSKRGYIMSLPESIYNIIHKNKNDIKNIDKYNNIHMYILYNNYQKHLRTGSIVRGKYQSKKSIRRLKKRMNIKQEHAEINKMKNKIFSTIKLNKRNVNP